MSVPAWYCSDVHKARRTIRTPSDLIALHKRNSVERNLELLAEFKANKPEDQNLAALVDGVAELAAREGADRAADAAAEAMAAIAHNVYTARFRFIAEFQAATTASDFIALLKYKPAEFNLALLAEFKANKPIDPKVVAQLEGIVEAGVREMAAGGDRAAVFAAIAEAAIVPDYNDAVARFVIDLEAALGVAMMKVKNAKIRADIITILKTGRGVASTLIDVADLGAGPLSPDGRRRTHRVVNDLLHLLERRGLAPLFKAVRKCEPALNESLRRLITRLRAVLRALAFSALIGWLDLHAKERVKQAQRRDDSALPPPKLILKITAKPVLPNAPAH